MNLPRIQSYKGHPNANAMRLEFADGVTVWFSYSTTVAFHTPESGLVVRKNEWGPTTGKHLNMIEAQAGGSIRDRVGYGEFCELWEKHTSGTTAAG